MVRRSTGPLLVRRALVALALLVALPVGAEGAGAASPPTTGVAAPATGTGGTAGPDEADALTWSVRPTPTEDEPDRSNFSFDLEPGATVHDSVRVRNYGTEPLPLAVYASDAVTTASGGLDLLPAGEVPTDIGSWIVLDTSTIEIPPQGYVDVPFTMVVPRQAESGDHVGGIVTSSRAPATNSDGQAVVVDRRLGNRVQVRVEGELRPALAVADVDVGYTGTVNPVGAGRLRVRYTVTNTGNVRAGASQRIVVPGRFGFPGREVQLGDMGELLPGDSLDFDVEVPDVWGTLRTEARVELQPTATRAGDVFAADTAGATAAASSWSVPWTLLLLIAVLALTPVWRRWARARRARQDQERIQQAVQTAVLVQEAVQAALAARTAPGAVADPVAMVPPASPAAPGAPVAPVVTTVSASEPPPPLALSVGAPAPEGDTDSNVHDILS